MLLRLLGEAGGASDVTVRIGCQDGDTAEILHAFDVPCAWLRSTDIDLSESDRTELLATAGESLPSAIVVDVGRDDAGRWAVIEANAAWASGCSWSPIRSRP